MDTNSKTYEEGFADGVSSYIEFCTKHPDCMGCSMLNEFDGDTTCEEFILKNKVRAASIILQSSGTHSYFAEYRLRFPHSNIRLEDMAESACRKAIFNGDMSCTGGDCLSCWNEQYSSDIEG